MTKNLQFLSKSKGQATNHPSKVFSRDFKNHPPFACLQLTDTLKLISLKEIFFYIGDLTELVISVYFP